jgi:hypothetical protein
MTSQTIAAGIATMALTAGALGRAHAPAVKIEEISKVPVGGSLTVPPLSASIYELRTR